MKLFFPHIAFSLAPLALVCEALPQSGARPGAGLVGGIKSARQEPAAACPIITFRTSDASSVSSATSQSEFSVCNVEQPKRGDNGLSEPAQQDVWDRLEGFCSIDLTAYGFEPDELLFSNGKGSLASLSTQYPDEPYIFVNASQYLVGNCDDAPDVRFAAELVSGQESPCIRDFTRLLEDCGTDGGAYVRDCVRWEFGYSSPPSKGLQRRDGTLVPAIAVERSMGKGLLGEWSRKLTTRNVHDTLRARADEDGDSGDEEGASGASDVEDDEELSDEEYEKTIEQYAERGARLWKLLQDRLRDISEPDKKCDKSVLAKNHPVDGMDNGMQTAPDELASLFSQLGESYLGRGKTAVNDVTSLDMPYRELGFDLSLTDQGSTLIINLWNVRDGILVVVDAHKERTQDPEVYWSDL